MIIEKPGLGISLPHGRVFLCAEVYLALVAVCTGQGHLYLGYCPLLAVTRPFSRLGYLLVEKRYQVFISSTFRDLEVERQKVLLALQMLNHIPAGMEFFPSANDTPWDVIKKVIELSDYYVLIIGGRYGSVDSLGISYTEREYDLAIDASIPILPFLHANPGEIAMGKSETLEEARLSLQSFREKVMQSHHCNYWENANELATKVVVALVNQIANVPRSGWVRANFAEENVELLAKIESVRAENDLLRKRLLVAQQEIASTSMKDAFLQGADEFTLELTERVAVEDRPGEVKHEYKRHVTKMSVHELFMALAWPALTGATAESLKTAVAKHVDGSCYVDQEMWQKIVVQLLALDLIAVTTELRAEKNRSGLLTRNAIQDSKNVVPTEIWRLTEKGRMIYAESKAVRRNEGTDAEA